MKKILLAVCILSIFLLAGRTDAVMIDVVPDEATTNVNEIAWYTINIENERYMNDEFVITAFGRHMEWLNLESYYVKIDGKQSKKIKMYFYPNDVGNYEYEILVYSRSRLDIKDREAFKLEVLPEKPVKLHGFSAEKVGDGLEIGLVLWSKDKRYVEAYFEIMDENGKRVNYVEITRQVDGETEIRETIPIGDFLAGKYEVRMGIGEYGISGKTSFYVMPVHKVVKKKEIVSTPFGDEVTIIVKNDGNVPEDYSVSENLPANAYVDFEDMPTSANAGEDGVNYNWRVDGLAVGKIEEITYTINNIPLIAGTLIIVFCIIGLLGMGNVKVRTPNIRKKYVRRGGEHLIILEIKGSLMKSLNNVMVKDRVSPLGRVNTEFEGPKPIVRESEAGTELIWRLGDVRPRSEIFLTYRIRPLIQAQQLKMPRAFLTYRTGDDSKVRVFSKQIVLE